MVGFERRLAAMERDGQLMPNRKGVLLPTKLDFVAGKVLGHRDGFGFLLRDDGGPDLFLSPREMLKVLHGDRVLVKPGGEYRGKPEGTIVEVIERRTNKLVGRFLHEHGLSIVVPEDQRIKHDILIRPATPTAPSTGRWCRSRSWRSPRATQPLGRVRGAGRDRRSRHGDRDRGAQVRCAGGILRSRRAPARRGPQGRPERPRRPARRAADHHRRRGRPRLRRRRLL